MPSMASKGIAFLLALLLFWASIATQEPYSPSARTGSDTAADAWVDGPPGNHAEGSVNDHHLDDLPSQAHAEPSHELVAMLPAAGHPRFFLGVALRPTRYAPVALSPPDLDGPRKPPRTAVLPAQA